MAFIEIQFLRSLKNVDFFSISVSDATAIVSFKKGCMPSQSDLGLENSGMVSFERNCCLENSVENVVI